MVIKSGASNVSPKAPIKILEADRKLKPKTIDKAIKKLVMRGASGPMLILNNTTSINIIGSPQATTKKNKKNLPRNCRIAGKIHTIKLE